MATSSNLTKDASDILCLLQTTLRLFIIYSVTSLNPSFPDHSLYWKCDSSLNDITEVVVGYLASFLKIHQLKHLAQVLVSNHHIDLLQQSLELLKLHEIVVVVIEELEPVAKVLSGLLDVALDLVNSLPVLTDLLLHSFRLFLDPLLSLLLLSLSLQLFFALLHLDFLFGHATLTKVKHILLSRFKPLVCKLFAFLFFGL
jgi:hypothetical protein